MKAIPVASRVVYLLVILLSLAVLALVAFSPAGFLNTAAVYRGF